MNRRVGLRAALWLTLGLAGLACRSDPAHPPPPPPPPPLPVPPSVPSPPAEPIPGEQARGEVSEAPAKGAEVEAADERASRPRSEGQAGAKTASAGASLYDLAKSGKATLPASASASSVPTAATPEAPAKPAPAPTPAAPSPAPAPKPATKVKVPSTAHVRVEVPAGLQATLDRDTRMTPWLNKAIAVIDDCYGRVRAKDAAASGIITAHLTMHSESRPSADVGSVPASLSSVVVCATGGLMGVKMPLFTGNEGERFTIRVHFQN